jgi:hypothetical protein
MECCQSGPGSEIPRLQSEGNRHHARSCTNLSLSRHRPYAKPWTPTRYEIAKVEGQVDVLPAAGVLATQMTVHVCIPPALPRHFDGGSLEKDIYRGVSICGHHRDWRFEQRE